MKKKLKIFFWMLLLLGVLGCLNISIVGSLSADIFWERAVWVAVLHLNWSLAHDQFIRCCPDRWRLVDLCLSHSIGSAIPVISPLNILIEPYLFIWQHFWLISLINWRLLVLAVFIESELFLRNIKLPILIFCIFIDLLKWRSVLYVNIIRLYLLDIWQVLVVICP